MAISIQYAQKLKRWMQEFRTHADFTHFNTDSSQMQIRTSADTQSILVNIKGISNIKPPKELETRGALQYNLQTFFTLYSKSRGFFGRSQVGQVI